MDATAEMVSISHNAAAETLISLEKSIKCEEIEESIEPYMNYISIQDATTVEDITTEHHIVQEETLIEFEDVKGSFKCSQCDHPFSSFAELVVHFSDHRNIHPNRCFHCGVECESKEDFYAHSQAHIVPMYYKCPSCSFETEQRSAIEQHMQAGHETSLSTSKTHQCPICEKYFETQNRLKNHLNKCSVQFAQAAEAEEISAEDLAGDMLQIGIKEESDEVNAVFTCPICFFIFTCKRKASQHIATVHFQMTEKSDVVEVNAESETESEVGQVQDVETDLQMNPSVALERIYLCPICHYVFTSFSSLNKHVVTHKNVTECPVCKYEFESNSELKDHLESHTTGETDRLCIVCNSNFETLDDLTDHIKEQHSKSFKCPYCPRSIKTENALKLHIDTHSRLKEYYCPKCKFTAKNSSVLQFHMSRYHRPKKQFSCKFCNKAYKFKFSLQRHTENCAGKDIDIHIQNQLDNQTDSMIEIDTSQRQQFICSECGETFDNADILKKHLIKHYEKLPFRCVKCAMRFKSKYYLSRHLKTHKLSAKYECRVCHKKFQVKHALNNHLISHTDERPFTCELCGLKFKRKSNYRRHYDGHIDSRPFKCTKCDFSSRRKDGLQKHIIQHEMEVGTP